MKKRSMLAIASLATGFVVAAITPSHGLEAADALGKTDGLSKLDVEGTLGEVGKAFAVRRPGARVTADDLIAWSRREMANYKVPRQVEFVAELPRNASGKVVKLAHDGQEVAAEDVSDHDYSIPGLFALLRGDLRLADVPAVGDTPPIDLRASFDPETGRLVRYRRTVGSARRRVLFIEVVEYQPATAAVEDAAVAQRPRG